jgi:ferredoxin-NADP reductase
MGDFGSELYGRGAAGLEMNVIPPRGKFLLPDDAARPLLFIAGGSGVTPYRGMMRYIMQQKLPTLVTVLYSARTPQDIIFKAEFEQMCAQTLDFKFVVTCTRCTPADHWAGWHGRITPSMVLELMQDPERTVCYVCGGRDFVRGTAAMLAELSLPKERLVYEDSG